MPPDDGTNWKVSNSDRSLYLQLLTCIQGALADLRAQQTLIRSPNVKDTGYIRQKQAGKLWVRERLDALLDEGSFCEVGSISGKPLYDEKSGDLTGFTPA